MSSDVKRSKSLVKRTKSFFGVESDYSVNEIEAWNQRRLKFCVNKFGGLNQDRLRQNDISQSINAGDFDSMVGNVDDLDASVPMSSIVPSNFNATFSSRNTQGLLSKSIISPQVSVQQAGVPLRKPHAFRAIASVVAESIAKQKNARQDDIPEHILIKDTSGDNEDPIEMQFVSLKSETAPVRIRDDFRRLVSQRSSMSDKVDNSVINRKKLKMSESMVERIRDGVKRINVRRRFTDSWMGRTLCCLPKHSDDTKRFTNQIDDIPQYRPYFTYWVSLVQLIVFISSLSVFGLAPIRMDFIHKEIGEVVVPSASIEQVCRVEYVNLFVGLRQSDLIKLGARYSPCMRKDKNLHKSIIEDQQNRDRKSGCCIRNDGGGCYQTSKKLCSSTLATWSEKKYERQDYPLNSIVCGLDPEFCEQPKSLAPFQWKEDFIKWPICQKQTAITANVSLITGRHMRCEVSGRPCCIGSKAECIITTRQHCKFLRGYYHPDAALCSQINCLNEICGMLSFYDPDRPDQFYRLITAIFVNSSLGSLVVTLSIQLTIMRDLEKMAGWHRIAIIYILSGIVGNLCSGIFLPYQVQTGSSGSIFALLAMTFTEFLQSWKIVKKPWPVFFKFVSLGIFLFLLGFLPFFDNFAHMSGLLSGIILSFIFLPFLGMPNMKYFQKLNSRSESISVAVEKFQQQVKRQRLFIIFGCSATWIVLTTICFIFFYWLPVTQCSFCKYFNCIPIAPYFCDNMDVNVTSKTACVIND